ncbi:DUF6559 family protein [Vibrio nigripulchritudo]|uniref:DUF6559 family protein n=1 Tax=Vibrio nigripulchritudo TaxID=28173 RepID=UPI0003B210ED|nr:DUF6559 family protein [Vibrio nigripulchritudo]CCN70386.1 conserved hypothetical protein [Vibrio nigripulchritudo SFn118]
MFDWSKKKIAKSVAKEVTPRLAVKYGIKEHYSKEEIDWALVALDKSSDPSYSNYAYGMMASQSLYMSLGLSSSFGAHPDFHREVSEILFNHPSATTADKYLEYASTHGVSSPKPDVSHDGFGSAGAESDFSSGGGDSSF